MAQVMLSAREPAEPHGEQRGQGGTDSATSASEVRLGNLLSIS